MCDFKVRDWRAWTPGIKAFDKHIIDAADQENPERVPKLLQRRLSPLAKAVFIVADSCFGGSKSLPIVFSSAHGEICKSLTMLQTIQAKEELSPTAFSLSVHNAIAGLFSIAFAIRQEITVIAPGQEGIAPGFIEALGLLQEGAEEVLVLFYDEPIAEFYPTAPFKLNVPYPCVVGILLGLTGTGLSLKMTRSNHSRDDGEHPVQLLSLINFLQGEARLMDLGNRGLGWTWLKL